VIPWVRFVGAKRGEHAPMSDMRRRECITPLGGAAAAWPVAARAQQPERVRRIGVLLTLAESDLEMKAWITAFQEGLQRLGWAQGRNILIDYRSAGGDQERLKSYATELLRMAPDVLFCQGVPALLALHHETRSLPIVFVQVSDPVGLGFVANLARPSGNVTGFTNFEHAIGSKWLELIKDTVPGVTRVEVIFDPENPLQFPYVQAIEAATPSFGVELTLAGVRNAAEIERAIDAFAHSKGAIIVLPSFVTLSHRDLIIALTARYALPAIYSYRVFTSGGGFISYGIDLADAYWRAFELVVNLKTAKALGLTIPEPFLQRADEVIE